jgi:cobyrinic acid a,c-diamide synthase
MCQLLAEGDEDISIVEGVMGYYDGIAYSDKASCYEVAYQTNTPVILIVDCKGMSNSIGAVLKGFVNYRENSHIAGIIFNRLPSNLYDVVSYMALDLGVETLGYLPNVDEGLFARRHLGLVTPDNMDNFLDKVKRLADNIEKYIDVDKLIKIAQSAEALEFEPVKLEKKYDLNIAVASDKAFCFHYADNIATLKKLGCKVTFFSPLKDSEIPADADGLFLSGGYPELYANELSENSSMLKDVKRKIEGGLPTIAECGGFMYLHDEIEDLGGTYHKMVGLINDRAFNTNRMHSHFGYITMKAKKDNLLCKKGETFTAHEFHYYDSDNYGDCFDVSKPISNKKWMAGNATDTLYAGFPHLYFWSNIEMTENFLKKCTQYKRKRK